MDNLLPPQAGLVVDGVVIRYTIVKDPETDAFVIVRNEDLLGPGYVYEHIDDWSGLPGNTLFTVDTFDGIGAERFGDGEIVVEGDAFVLDPYVGYRFRYDTCFIVLSDPSCPGYAEAMRQWLLENTPQPGDEYYDEYVQLLLDRETVEVEEEVEEEQVEEEENELSDADRERALLASDRAFELAGNAEQAALYSALANGTNIESYYQLTIDGGVYEETLTLIDSRLPDNPSALRNLSTDRLHREMVRSQYRN